MTTRSEVRMSPAAAQGAAQTVASVVQAFLVNVAAIVDVLFRVRQIHANGQKMADMLREADRLQAVSPVRAAALRNAARRIVLV
jgi:hypothetical protein